MLDLFLIYLRSTNSSSPPPPPKKHTQVTPSCLPPQSVHGSLPTTAMSPRTAVNFQVSPTVSVLSNTTLHTVRPRNLHRPLSVLQCLESNCFLLPVSLTVKKRERVFPSKPEARQSDVPHPASSPSNGRKVRAARRLEQWNESQPGWKNSPVPILACRQPQLLRVGGTVVWRLPLLLHSKEHHRADLQPTHSLRKMSPASARPLPRLHGFTNAFDRVWRAALWATMKKYNIGTKPYPSHQKPL